MMSVDLVGLYCPVQVSASTEAAPPHDRFFRKIERAHQLENSPGYVLQLSETLVGSDFKTEIPFVRPAPARLVPYRPMTLISYDAARAILAEQRPDPGAVPA